MDKNMDLKYSFLLMVFLLAFAGCTTGKTSTLDMITMTASLDGEEISLDAFQAYLEDEANMESTITVMGLNEVEIEMKPHEVISAYNQMLEEFCEYYFPEGGDRASHDYSLDPENPFNKK
jgi:hypothetical protein